MPTKLTDVVVPEVFDPYVTNQILELSTILNSGIAVTDPRLNAFLQGGGQTMNMPFWNQVTVSDEANVSSDNDASPATPKKFTAGKNIGVRHGLNQAWSSMDLAATLAGSDPMQALAGQIVEYWDVRAQARLVASVVGVIEDNIANFSGDMVNDIWVAAAPTDANRISAEACIDAWATLGDKWNSVTAIGMHSVTYFHLQKLNLIDFIPDARGETMIETYQGKRIIVNDENYVDTAGLAKYYTVFYGTGACAYANEPGKVPSEVEREALQGDGGGQETIVSRQQFVVHPNGFSFDATGIAGESPTIAELVAAANWTRNVERKRVPMACLIHNG